MSSEIGYKDLLRYLQTYLQLRDQDGVGRLQTEEVIPVVDVVRLFKEGLNPPVIVPTPGNGLGYIEAKDSSADLNGLVNGTFGIVGDNIGSTRRLDLSKLYNYRFDALDLVLDFNAAGAIAFNGKKLILRLRYTNGADPAQSGDLLNYFPWCTVQTGRLDYCWTLKGNAAFVTDLHYGGNSWDGAFLTEPTVLASSYRFMLYFDIFAEDGTAFPASTTLYVRAKYRYTSSLMCPIPL